MFDYTDPTGTGVLDQQGALPSFRSLVHTWYRQEARKPNSGFTLLSAFDQVKDDPDTIIGTIDWAAFPKISPATDQEIDKLRFVHQDEYVEWRVERDPNDKIVRITFTTELYEGLQALAEVSEAALVAGVQDIITGANPTTAELFGPDFSPENASPDDRGEQFVANRRMNPWNSGGKGILCLGHRNSTMSALFILVGDCTINRHVNPVQVCGISSCVPGRNSDPSICSAAQQLTQSDRITSLVDPVGIKILELRGIWKLGGQQIDINDGSQHGGIWRVSRNGRRGVLEVAEGLTMGDDPIETGAQVSRALFVGADVISSPSSKVPAWAQTGQESSRVIA